MTYYNCMEVIHETLSSIETEIICLTETREYLKVKIKELEEEHESRKDK